MTLLFACTITVFFLSFAAGRAAHGNIERDSEKEILNETVAEKEKEKAEELATKEKEKVECLKHRQDSKGIRWWTQPKYWKCK